MKRRLLSAFLAVMMVLTMAPVAFAADTETTTEYVAQVDGNKYETLADAIEAANDGDTITLLKGGNGNGFKVPEGKFTEQGLTIDFNQFTYMIGGQLVGSAGTGTNGYQLLKNNKITFKNGSFVGATEGSKPADDTPDWHGAPAIMIQNYCDLTLENMIVTGGDETVYTFSNNCGNTVIKDSTINAGKAKGYGSGPFAFDVCRYSTYPSVSVTVQGSSVINGDVEISGTIGEGQSRQLNIEDGTFNGRFIVSNTPANISITGGKFSSDVSAYVAEGYVQNENGTVEQLGETNAVAKIGDTYYKTLAEAVSAADNNTVTLLKNTVEDVVIPADKTITLDLNGKKIVNSTTAQDSKVADDARKHTITNNGTLTIMDSVGGGVVDNVSHGRAALYNNGTITEIKGGKFTRSVDNSTDSESANGNSWYVVYNAEGATISKISNGEFLALGHFSSLFSNCGTINEISGGTFTQDHFIAFKNEGTVNKISGGVFSSADESCIQNWGTIGEICGGTITAGGLGVWNFSSDHWTSVGKVEKISGGEISGTTAALRVYNYDVMYEGAVADNQTNKAFIKVTGGKINGALEVSKAAVLSISGGYFTTDPSKYLATYTDAEKKYIAKAVTGDYKFHVELADANDLQVVPVAGATSAPSKKELENNKDIPPEAVDNIVAAAKAVSAPEISKAAQEVAANISDNSNTLDKQYQDAAKNEVPNQEKIEVRAYLEVKPTAYNGSAYTLDITPKYDVVVVGTKNGATAKKVVETNTLNVTKATVVTMELPAGFAVDNGAKLSIQHTKSNGKVVEYYTGTVTEQSGKHLLTFTTNGFSPFVISVPAASIGENVYPTLQAAVDSVESGKTIKLEQDVAADTKVTVAKSINFKVDTNGKTFDAAKNIVAGSNTTVKVTGESSPYTYEFTYTKPSSGGSSSGKTTYKVTTSAVNNGGVNASPSSAEKGATITITLSPDKGYKLDKLTVTDGSGKSVSTVKKSDTVYTFTMPASAVKVGVSYVKATETPSETKFNDVSANDWFASAVDYVTGKGMMNGTAANTFSPKANTTRGMLMTVLARHAGEDTTGGSVWYEKGMNWAKANGVSDGTNPQVNITREQLAAMLYRYAQNKKYDVSGAKSLDGYTDAQSVSSYAVPALQWANAAGVVNGKSGSKLDPKGYATRAEVAAMLMRFCENVEK